MIIDYKYNGDTIVSVEFENDAFFNASVVAAQFSKIQNQRREVGKFLGTKETKEYAGELIKYLSSEFGKTYTEDDLIRKSTSGEDRGVWLHPKLAILFARFLDVRFALWCDLQIEKILHGGGQIAPCYDLDQINETIKHALSVATGLGYNHGQAIRFANQCVIQKFNVDMIKVVSKFSGGETISINKISQEIGCSPRAVLSKLKLINIIDDQGKLTELGSAYAKEIIHGDKMRLMFYKDITDLLK